jgi:hypothetical protein
MLDRKRTQGQIAIVKVLPVPETLIARRDDEEDHVAQTCGPSVEAWACTMLQSLIGHAASGQANRVLSLSGQPDIHCQS